MKKYLWIGLVPFLGACSNPKDANNENFEKAIQSYLDGKYPKCYFVSNFPTESNQSLMFGNADKLSALAKAGLLSETELSRKTNSWDKKVRVNYSYDLTDEGRNYYKSDVWEGATGKKKGGFCFGKAKITSIDSFTEPADMMGQIISRVNYSYTVTGFPEWAKNATLLESHKELKKEVSSNNKPVSDRDVLLLTNNGWIHERLFKKKP